MSGISCRTRRLRHQRSDIRHPTMSLSIVKPFARPGVRRFGRVNWRGVWTLYVKEVMRFGKLWAQTVFAPVTTALLFLAIFALAIGRTRAAIPAASRP